MIAPQSFEELESESYVKIGQEFEDLWCVLRKEKAKVDLFLSSQNPFKQNLRDRIAIGAIGVSLDGVERFFGERRADRVRYVLWENARRISRGLLGGFDDHSRTILRSNRLWAPRYWEYPWAILSTQPRKGMQILDIGSGWSLFPMYLAKLGCRVTAVDTDVLQMTCISPFLSRLASARVHYRLGDATDLELPENSFDRVFCISVLEHLEEETRNGRPFNSHEKNLELIAIKEMLRVLKPRGLLAITVDWSEQPRDLRAYRFDDIMNRLVQPFESYLVSDVKPTINWTTYWPRLVKLWEDRFPFDTLEDALGEAGAAVGLLLRKPE